MMSGRKVAISLEIGFQIRLEPEFWLVER